MRALRCCWIVVALAPLFVGCTKSATVANRESRPNAFAFDDDKKPNQGPKRQPTKPDVCVSGGAVLERGGDTAKDPGSRQQNYHKARLAYSQALTIDPQCREALAGLARIESKEGNHAKAVEAFQAALAVYPNDAALWHDLGMCWGRQKDWNQAVAALHKAVTLEPANNAFATSLAWTLARDGQYQASFELFCHTVGEGRAHYNLARMADHLGQRDVSRQYLEAALRVEPNLAEAQQMLAAMNADGGVKAVQYETPR
jgi:tetratricopeptide (TPR) repeat protein